MTKLEAVAEADDLALLPLLGNNKQKLAALRDAIERWRVSRPTAAPATLPVYRP